MRGYAPWSRACARVRARSPSAAANGSSDQRSVADDDVAHRAMSRPVAPPSAMLPVLSTAPDPAVPELQPISELLGYAQPNQRGEGGPDIRGA